MVFIGYIIVGLPVALEPILTKTAKLVYLTELDNWVGTYLLVVMGLIEIIVAGWLMKDSPLDEINHGSYWQAPKWIYTVMIRWVTPLTIIVILIGSTLAYIDDGYFKFIPSFVEKTPVLIPWVNGARIVLLLVFIIGFTGTYKSLKAVYGEEVKQDKILIRK